MKRPPPNSDAEAASSVSKKRRRMSISDDDDGLKISANSEFDETPSLDKIYNHSSRKGSKEQPGELFRKDLISKMKLPDNEQLDDSEFWEVNDTWKQEWERGVQIPVHKHVPDHEVRIINEKRKASPYKMPKKLLRTAEDESFSNEIHVFSETGKKAEAICKYDMDDLDAHWLLLFNERREDFGLSPVNEETLEVVIEDFETQCSNRFQDALKTEKGLGIEYDEDVICDVCRSPECEEGNEMVFCDSCNICVHQACYGITAIPEGSWICRPCALNIKPPCILCPNMSGAMKSTRNEGPIKNSSGEKWAHVSCALWIPEVIIGCPEKMEPIMRISHVPASRWALICTLCRERVGACIQCSVKQCKVAYHVTCAFEHGLEMEMKTTATDSNEEGVKMQSFCAKHSKTDITERSLKTTRKTKKKREMRSLKEPECKNEVDEHNARLQKIRSLEAQFHRFVNIKDTAELQNVDVDIVDFLYYYWVLKRRTKFNKPLLITKCDEATQFIKQHENLLYSKLKMFVHLRQDLERVRNLCYMVSRREKIFRSYMRMKEQVLDKQYDILDDESLMLSVEEIKEVLRARLGDGLYDRFYCAVFDEEDKEEGEEISAVTNPRLPNPYAKNYINNVNTRSRRRTASHGTLEDSNPAFDNENREMPVLTKCKSEENLSQEEKQTTEKITFTHSPFVIKVAPKQDDECPAKPDLSSSVEPAIPEPNSDASKDSMIPLNVENSLVEETKCLEALKIVPENTNDNIEKIMNSSNEASSDKNSLCLSDKENINALAPVKVKKTRSQGESRHTEFKNVIQELSAQKPDIFDDDSCLSINSEICTLDEKKMPRRNTRYQMRARNFDNDVIEIDESSIKSVDSIDIQLLQPQSISSPSDSVEELGSFTRDQSVMEEKSLDSTPSSAARRRRGRPRKMNRYDSSSNGDFTVIKDESVDTDKTTNLFVGVDNTNSPDIDLDKTNSSSINNDKRNSFDIMELSDSNESSGFRMSLRHNREILNHNTPNRKCRRKKSAMVPSGFFKQSNENNNADNESSENSPTWDSSEKSPRLNNVEKPASARIIIRLRKDPNRESWKNDSSSSDGNVAFRIVHSDIGVNGEDSVSHFPSIIKDEDSVQSEPYSVRNENEIRHRYLMRDRPVPVRTAKCNFSRS